MLSSIFLGEVALCFNNKIVEDKVRAIGASNFIVNAECFIGKDNFLFV
tara:strand:- start:8166 stop:8309 length:144 start_codon:yes stop_codon:yes gene_type:complete